MYGAIIGDIVGSYYEVLEIKNKNRSYEDRIKIMDRNVPLFNEICSCTDDSILTTAIADAILNGESYEKKLREYCLREINLGKDIYGRSRFGKGFVEWLKNDYMGESFGNGSAMRISPVGYLFNSIDEIKSESLNATIPSHNHIESIKSSEAVAVSIYLLRRGMNKDSLKEYIEKNYFSLEYDLDDLRKNYRFTSRAIDSVPQAIFCFLNSNDFEDAIRLSISIGGDSDTIACITGALAELSSALL
jgi:ADP-ribosylglycohydrolase